LEGETKSEITIDGYFQDGDGILNSNAGNTTGRKPWKDRHPHLYYVTRLWIPITLGWGVAALLYGIYKPIDVATGGSNVTEYAETYASVGLFMLLMSLCLFVIAFALLVGIFSRRGQAGLIAVATWLYRGAVGGVAFWFALGFIDLVAQQIFSERPLPFLPNFLTLFSLTVPVIAICIFVGPWPASVAFAGQGRKVKLRMVGFITCTILGIITATQIR